MKQVLQWQKCVVRIIFLALGLMGSNASSFGQNNMITLPTQSSTYTGYVRGFWFISPIDFTIIGLRVPVAAGSGDQSIQVMKIHSGGVALYSATGTNFTTLYYTNSGASNVIQQVSIPVSAGDTIGILGQVGTVTSYGPSTPSPFPSDISGVSVDLHRFIYQGDITSAPAPNYSSENTSSIGRIEVYYQIAPPDNAGVDSLLTPELDGDFCSGQQLVKARLSNLGSNSLASVNINWSVNGTPQQSQSLTFNPSIDSISSPNHDTIITLGSVDFPFQSPVTIKVWSSMPNGVTDTDPTDDTLEVSLTAMKESVNVTVAPSDTVICDGSSIILDAGQQPAGSVFIWSNGAVTRQVAVNQPGSYSVIVQSLQGCLSYDTVTITQNPQLIVGDFGIIDLGGNNFKFTPVNMENVTNYHWDFGDGDTLNVSTNAPQTHHYVETGTYAVSLTVGNACGATPINKQIYVQPTTGIEGVESLERAVKVYPNPARDKVKIVLPDNIRINKIVVYNVIGQKVYESTVENGYVAEIDLKSIGSGVYNIQVYTESGVATKKLNVLK